MNTAFWGAWILDSELFQVLATFVAINSLIYATLATLKVLPAVPLLLRSRGRNRRAQNRSIYPDAATRALAEAAERQRPRTS